jgi:hypothetical protein
MPDWAVQSPVSTVRPTPPRPKAAAGGGSSIYGDHSTITMASGDESVILSGDTLSVSLSVRSTIALSVSTYGLIGDDFGDPFIFATRVSVNSGDAATHWHNESSALASGGHYGAATAQGVITLPAGDHEFTPQIECNPEGTNPTYWPGFYLDLVVIVGSNTEQNSMSYGPS